MADDRHLPVIDLSRGLASVAADIDAACRDTGFFFVVGHGVPAELQAKLDRLAREFFARPDEEKAAIDMRHGGRAWRGLVVAGALLLLGLRVREALFALGGVLVIVTFGHLLHEPLFNFSGHVIPRLALLLFLLWCPRDDDRYSLDQLLRRREPTPVSPANRQT